MVGIYTITNLITHKTYVGYTRDLRARKNEHFSSLSKGTHQIITFKELITNMEKII